MSQWVSFDKEPPPQSGDYRVKVDDPTLPYWEGKATWRDKLGGSWSATSFIHAFLITHWAYPQKETAIGD